MTKEEIIKSALKFLVQKQTEQGSWGFSDADDDEVSWNEAIEWLKQEPCEDCVKRDDAIRLAEQGQIQGYEWQFKKLCNLPSVQPQSKKGKWIRKWCEWQQYLECSECEYETGLGCDTNYCPNCGAKMETYTNE